MCRITRQFQEGLNFDYVILWCQQVFCGLLSYLLVMHRNAEFHFFRENYSRLRFVCTMIFYLTLDIMDTFFPQFCWFDPQCDGGMNLLVRTLDSVVLRGFSVFFFFNFLREIGCSTFLFPVFQFMDPLGCRHQQTACIWCSFIPGTNKVFCLFFMAQYLRCRIQHRESQ